MDPVLSFQPVIFSVNRVADPGDPVLATALDNYICMLLLLLFSIARSNGQSCPMPPEGIMTAIRKRKEEEYYTKREECERKAKKSENNSKVKLTCKRKQDSWKSANETPWTQSITRLNEHNKTYQQKLSKWIVKVSHRLSLKSWCRKTVPEQCTSI